jgi:N4-gp56 family major capsid protein
MATQTFATGNALTAKLWAEGLNAEVIKKTSFSKFGGPGSDSLCQILDRTAKNAGDRITVGLRMQFTGGGVAGSGTLEGNEESLVTYSENLLIEQLRHAYRTKTRIDQQRVNFRLREEGRLGLSDWWADRLDTIWFNHLGGAVHATANTHDGHNTIVDPQAQTDTDHQIWVDGANNSDDESLASGDDLDVQHIDIAVEKAKTISPAIRPFVWKGKEYYVLFVHPYQMTKLRDSNSTWYAQMQAALQGGLVDGNPIFTGGTGVHNGVVIHENSRVPTGVNSTSSAEITTVRRAILCGAQAMLMAYGREGGRAERYLWDEETFDYKNEFGVAATLIFGMKATRFNDKEYGRVIISSYADANTAA